MIGNLAYNTEQPREAATAMFEHPILDIGLGLVFFYVILSLVVSAVQEWIASLLALRSKNLRSGIENMIGNEYAEKVYSHPLIKNLAKQNKLPSYIAPETLSMVLLEVVARESGDKPFLAHKADELRGLVGKIDEKHPLKDILAALIDEGDAAANALKERLSGWFDEGMTRVSGWYKRQAKVWIFLIAAAVTMSTNASTIHIAEELWRNDALRTQIAAQAQAAAHGEVAKLETGNMERLEAFPIGWKELPAGPLEFFKSLLGWLITAAAVSLGAPFWFDLLGKVANLRGSGGKAQTRKPS